MSIEEILANRLLSIIEDREMFCEKLHSYRMVLLPEVWERVKSIVEERRKKLSQHVDEDFWVTIQ